MESHSVFQIKVSEKIKKLRIEKGYSSYETFANDFELDRKQYWRIENGSNITLKTLERILSIHEISAKEFFKDFEELI
jgi:transcriptional regulator with XRE-family HTH domain